MRKKKFSYKKIFRKKILIKKFPSSLRIGIRVRAASKPSFRKLPMGVVNDIPFFDDHNGAGTTAVIGSHVRHCNRNADRKTKNLKHSELGQFLFILQNRPLKTEYFGEPG